MHLKSTHNQGSRGEDHALDFLANDDDRAAGHLHDDEPT